LSDSEAFILVYPQGIDKSWNDNANRNPYGEARVDNIDDVGFIEKMITILEAEYSIDNTNIFACGISNGGLMSATLATKLPSKIKAIGMVSSNFSKVHVQEMKEEALQPFSIIVIHGTEDPIFPYNEGNMSFFEQKRGEVLGAEKTISFMRKLNGNISEGIETQLPNYAPFDKCKSTLIEYPNPENPNLKVSLIKITGGGHTWPGGHQYLPKKIIGSVTRDFNAANKLWDFFKTTME
jgi:polyhydroxybutyrate depolymerase